MRTHHESSRLHAKKRVLIRTWPCCRLDLGLPASRNVRNKFLLFKPLHLWYFVEARAKTALYQRSEGEKVESASSVVGDSHHPLWHGNAENSWVIGCQEGEEAQSRTMDWTPTFCWPTPLPPSTAMEEEQTV